MIKDFKTIKTAKPTAPRPRLLWIGDAVTQTGFARVTHNVLAHLAETWDIAVLGLNYHGGPEGREYPYDIYPAANGKDIWGLDQVEFICRRFKPDVVMVLNDPWNIPPYLELIPDNLPVVAYCPVDAPNQRTASKLNKTTRVVAYTQFGRRELLLGGFTGRCDVVPHGIDTSVYYPMDKVQARTELFGEGKYQDSFIVGCVNRNQPRKRLDLVIQAWTQWWIESGQPPQAKLYLHSSNYDIGWDFIQLTKYYGMQSQLMLTAPDMLPTMSLTEAKMRLIYNSFDVQLNASMGEGWGLTTHEGMACRVAQAATDWAAIPEWGKDAIEFIPISGYGVTPNLINTIGGVMDVDACVKTLHKLYSDTEYRDNLAARGLVRATESRFKWSTVAQQFDSILMDTYNAWKQAQESVGTEKEVVRG